MRYIEEMILKSLEGDIKMKKILFATLTMLTLSPSVVASERMAKDDNQVYTSLDGYEYTIKEKIIDNENGKEILLPSYFVEVFKDTENPMIKYINCFIKSEKVDFPVEVIYRWYTLSEDGKRQYIDQNVIEYSNIIKINDRFFVSTR